MGAATQRLLPRVRPWAVVASPDVTVEVAVSVVVGSAAAAVGLAVGGIVIVVGSGAATVDVAGGALTADLAVLLVEATVPLAMALRVAVGPSAAVSVPTVVGMSRAKVAAALPLTIDPAATANATTTEATETATGIVIGTTAEAATATGTATAIETGAAAIAIAMEDDVRAATWNRYDLGIGNATVAIVATGSVIRVGIVTTAVETTTGNPVVAMTIPANAVLTATRTKKRENCGGTNNRREPQKGSP